MAVTVAKHTNIEGVECHRLDAHAWKCALLKSDQRLFSYVVRKVHIPPETLVYESHHKLKYDLGNSICEITNGGHIIFQGRWPIWRALKCD